ncbi:hypothetical protein [Agrobacterium vitis]|uniref:nSTAND3 domain-containing NTPase n=1 Tax=Agrobacterium vitis TaxID=373 RepID=UPI0008DBFEEB|nr:hypothetical protein [Agrobacterium vitis]MUO31005.1 hypothetical protein [Agrobacterium vitis]
MSEEDGGGNPSYAAYEYQIEASAWIAVDLLLARRLCNSITIEAKTKEDLEADVEQKFPTTGLSSDTRLTIQIKTKSTGAWTSNAFAKVLRGDFIRGDDGGAPPKGPAPRVRPLEMLRGETDRIYLFVTDAAIDPALFPFRVESAGDPSTASSLPYRSADNLSEDNDAEAIAPRISIMAGLAREWIRLRLEKLLRSHAHIAEQFIGPCISALIQDIRERMLARTDGVFSRLQLLQLLERHGGSINPSPTLDRFVEPKALRKIEALLKKENAVIITGPSGTGKTMTADYIEASLLKERGYEVVGGEDGPEKVRHALRKPGVYLFHLKDPFGKTRYLQAARPWASELLSLLKEAGPDKRFLITTRSDVIHESKISSNSELDRRLLERYSVSLEATDYSDEARALIYDNHVRCLKGGARRFAVESRKRALSQLLKPFEIDRFVLAIELSDENRDLDKLIGQSQVEAIARVVCEQITDSEERLKAVASAAILWALVAGSGAANREMLRPIRRSLRGRDIIVDLESFSELMVLGNNLRDVRGNLTFTHPQIAKGFLLAMQADANVAEDALTALIGTLVQMDDGGAESDDWGVEAVNKFRRQLIDDELGIELVIDRRSSELLDRQLESVLQSEDSGRFANRVRNIALLGSKGSISARFARSLVHESKSGRKTKARSYWGHFWSLSDEDAEMARQFATSELCRFIARRFVSDMLLETSISYRSGLAEYLCAIDPTVSTLALDLILERVSNPTKTVNNLSAAIWLALSSESPPANTLIDFFLGEARKRGADLDSEQVRQATQKVLDEGYSEFVLERVMDELFLPSEGLQSCIRWLRKYRPSELHAHPSRDDILSDWLTVCEEDAKSVSAAEIDLLFELCVHPAERAGLWKIIGKSGITGYIDRLLVEIAADWKSGPDLRRARIAALFALTPEFATRIRKSIPAGAEACLLSVISDYSSERFDFEGEEEATRAHVAAELLEGLSPEFPALLDLIEKGGHVVHRGLELPDAETINGPVNLASGKIIVELPEDLQIALAVATPDLPSRTSIADALVDSKEVHIAAAAVKLLGQVASKNTAIVSRLWGCLKYPEYAVREAALAALIPIVSIADRPRIVGIGSEDESSSVRLCFAASMQIERWPEAIGALCDLLSDIRDFDPYPSAQARRTSFDVAREAAAALCSFPALSTQAVDEVISRASAKSDDDNLESAFLSVLRVHSNSSVDNWLLSASTGAVQGLSAASALWELVQRAGEGAWALPKDDRTHAALIASATSDNDDISIPAAIAIALQPEQSLIERTWSALDGANGSKLKSVVSFAAILRGVPEVRSWIVEQLNPLLPQDRIAQLLVRFGEGDKSDLDLDAGAKDWLHALDPDTSVDQRLRMFLEGLYDPEQAADHSSRS